MQIFKRKAFQWTYAIIFIFINNLFIHPVLMSILNKSLNYWAAFICTLFIGIVYTSLIAWVIVRINDYFHHKQKLD